MAARDLYHDNVRNALIKDGWTITHDPLSLPWGDTGLQVDLGAEKLIAAVKAEHRIAVEVKSFLSKSRVEDLEDALRQMVLYRYLIRQTEPDCELFLAIRGEIYQTFMSKDHVTGFLKSENVRLLVFDANNEEVLQWINWKDTEALSNKP
ncbi:MAG: element excision factor XisH family protein [Acidobacteriota bacterium]